MITSAAPHSLYCHPAEFILNHNGGNSFIYKMHGVKNCLGRGVAQRCMKSTSYDSDDKM